MLKIFLILFFIILAFKLYKSKIHIDFKSFFKRGFKKLDNKFRCFLLCWKTTENGKTYSATKFVYEQKEKYGYTLITNVLSFKAGTDTIYMTDINKIMDYVNKHYKDTKFIILFDEIFTLLDKNLPVNKKIRSFLSQLRKKKIIFVTTAQEWSEINITFRRYVRFEIDCNMFALPFSKIAFIFNKINDGDKMRWNNDLMDFTAPTIASNFAKCNIDVINRYDTFEVINVS